MFLCSFYSVSCILTSKFCLLFFFRSYLKIRIFVRDQGETGTQPAGILKYVEDLRRRLNTDIGPSMLSFDRLMTLSEIEGLRVMSLSNERKDFFEMASN